MNFGTFKTGRLDMKANRSSELQKHKHYPELVMLLFNLHEFKTYSPGDI